jgi:hypothetical protein
MPEKQIVYVVVKCEDAGVVAGVFSSLYKANDYVEKHKYSGFIVSEHTVDKAQ